MAKWGQGDPRWIVEERADATNVNNWHWWAGGGREGTGGKGKGKGKGSGGRRALTAPLCRRRTERDATGWSKSKLKEVLVGLAVEGEAGRCEISELKQAEGEASCSSRKGKLIFFYEWNLRLAWRGAGAAAGGASCGAGGVRGAGRGL